MVRANRKQTNGSIIIILAKQSDVQANRSYIQTNRSANFTAISLNKHIYGQHSM